jgi:predicted GIY-YIG superfamily endonuclease
MYPVRPLWYYTYVLKSEKDGKFYVGITNNLNTD